MQDVCGGKKWSMEIFLLKPGKISKRNIHGGRRIRNGGSRNIFTNKRLLWKFYRGSQLRSQSWIKSKLLLALEIGEILEIALYEVVEEGQCKKWRTSCRSGVRWWI
jgi:hypothetical protein